MKNEELGVETIEFKINGENLTFSSQEEAETYWNETFAKIPVNEGIYKVDAAHSSVDFSIRHIISDTKGTIGIDSGYVELNEKPIVKIWFNIKSINTGNKNRDKHLLSEDFFDAKKYPTAYFESDSIVRNAPLSDYAYSAYGKLTLHGKTADVILQVNFEGKAEKENEGQKYYVVGFTGKGQIKRSSFDIAPDSGLGDDVKINFTLEGIKK
ncbi:MAG: YceI family protein [Bacteroidia bacterium]|nr:YceI family protein [Bacteroidia bacterium]